MINRFILNEVSYFGPGAREVLPKEISRLGLHKAFVATDKDLIKFGSFGLLNAIDEYEPDIDIKFKNYALIGIMAYIYEEMWKIKTSPTKDIQNLINIILNENKEEE